MSRELTIEQRVQKLEREFAEMKRRPKWTKVGTIQELTGWNRERLRRARVNGEIIMKKKNGKIFYDLNSLNPLLVKKQLTA